jgi:hypothetical protein
MNARRLCLLLILALPLAAAPAARESEDYARLKAHIEALLGHRRQRPPAPGEESNPFRKGTAPARGSVVVTSSTSADKAETAGDTAAPVDEGQILFASLVQSLRIGGAAEIRGEPHLIINGTPHKAGDTINARSGDATYPIKIAAITATHVTFQLGPLSQTVSIR